MMDSSTPHVLDIRKLGRFFAGVRAIDDISFTVSPGETVAIVGPNGAGKSTLVQLMSGVDHADRGSIHFAGRDITRARPDVIAALGIARTFQTSRVFPGLSVLESVAVGTHPDLLGWRGADTALTAWTEYGAAVLGLPFWRRRLTVQQDRAETVLKLFGDRLWPRRHQPAMSLSYANRRRLDIARALVSDPRFLLLDEPAAGMNPTETAELAALLSSIRAARPEMALILIEHKLSFVRSLCERVLIMTQGKILIDDIPLRAFSHPAVIAAYLGQTAQTEAIAS